MRHTFKYILAALMCLFAAYAFYNDWASHKIFAIAALCFAISFIFNAIFPEKE